MASFRRCCQETLSPVDGPLPWSLVGWPVAVAGRVAGSMPRAVALPLPGSGRLCSTGRLGSAGRAGSHLRVGPPRKRDSEADALADGRFGGFDPELRAGGGRRARGRAAVGPQLREECGLAGRVLLLVSGGGKYPRV